ncbi:hypothetical protein [Deinococcus yavapaiensis]|uniref:Uncharacterized protein n=1 Tax=Deinococcus yavapaiensis KR-236 TaxID=694435 RepID=A0A318S922_9DEIO|nr:hypothetical protein [Deinococcus yavapaiensis]PYE54635.1 hypothetical protein DES52_105275 [Deinococcus yavapaiensis KR-236]
MTDKTDPTLSELQERGEIVISTEQDANSPSDEQTETPTQKAAKLQQQDGGIVPDDEDG